MTEDDIERVVNATLEKLGIDVDDHDAQRRDFLRLREWRNCMDTVQNHGILTVLGIALAGAIAAFWLGLKALIK